MKLFDEVEPIYFIDDEMNKLLNDIDNKEKLKDTVMDTCKDLSTKNNA